MFCKDIVVVQGHKCVTVSATGYGFISIRRGFRTPQGRQRESSVKTLRNPFFNEFWRHCVVSGETQRRALPRREIAKNKMLNIFNITYIVLIWFSYLYTKPNKPTW